MAEVTSTTNTKQHPSPADATMNDHISRNGDTIECRDAVEESTIVADAHQNVIPTDATTPGFPESGMNSCEASPASAESDEKQVEELNHETIANDTGDVPTSSGIDYSNLEEAPYEHGFEPGDHVIRWDMLPILWPIQIHGIVLEVSADKTTVTICDFGITAAKTDDEVNTNLSVETIVAEDDAKFKEALKDVPSELQLKDGDKKEVIKNKVSKRLNVIQLTKWSDLRKWHKVNYDNGLFPGGVGKSLKGLGEKTEKLWTSMTKSFAKRESSEIKDDYELLNEADNFELLDVQQKIVQAVKRKDSSGKNDNKKSSIERKTEEAASCEALTATSAKEKMLNDFLFGDTTDSELKSESITPHTLEKPESNSIDTVKDDLNEPKTLAQMIAEANEIEKQSPRKIVVKSPPSSPKKTAPEKKGSLSKSKSMSTEGEGGEPSSKVKKGQSTSENLPRSDPALLVLARTRFLLAQGEDFLPPYHIVNSNSECIAVWCKTGRWSTLQASVFLHSTAIGNAKSTTAISLTLAATQPWLLPAIVPAGIAAVGTPWLMLKVANDKWNDATITLGEKFWMQADPEVFVECIKKWGRLK
eukprot:CCRYP_004974-RA/>CCRYP_004974-RA protein AED:0.26 eAED:0.26 QI:36/1/1/1/1/1/2/123/586